MVLQTTQKGVAISALAGYIGGFDDALYSHASRLFSHEIRAGMDCGHGCGHTHIAILVSEGEGRVPPPPGGRSHSHDDAFMPGEFYQMGSLFGNREAAASKTGRLEAMTASICFRTLSHTRSSWRHVYGPRRYARTTETCRAPVISPPIGDWQEETRRTMSGQKSGVS